MTWINFLHFYQPANSEDRKIKEAIAKSYCHLVEMLTKNPKARFTANISGCLLERMQEMGEDQIILGFKKLIKSGQLEIVGSLSHHPIAPLISEKELIYQIKNQERILSEILHVKKLQGFFLPEMAYSPAVGKIIKKLGYQWLILDEIHCKETVNYGIDKQSGLKVIFRNHRISTGYPPDLILGESRDVITATDAELYGLKHIDYHQLNAVMKFANCTISEYLQDKELTKLDLRSASWESTEKELRVKNYYALWNSNQIHQALWQLADFCLGVVNGNLKDKNYTWARWHLSRGLASCSFWWASEYDFSHHFGPLAWSPEEIEKGINDLVRSIRSLESKKTKLAKIKVEKLVLKLRLMVWTKHWQKHF